MDKRTLRTLIRKELGRLSEEEKAKQSEEIYRHLMSLTPLRSAKVVALFASLPDEPSTTMLANELSLRCKVVMPRIAAGEMDFYPYIPGGMRRGAYNIMEPTSGEAIVPSAIDAIIVPGVAFTTKGERMGRGKGFYDKYLSRHGVRAYKIGICFHCQLVDYLPLDKHDVKMDIVVCGKTY